MSKFFVLLLYMNILYSLSFGQTNYVLKGMVVDENNKPLTGASVFLYPIKGGTITDNAGKFAINNLKKGDYVIKISFIGYNTLIDTIEISKDKTYNARLSIASLSLQEVVVTDNYVETRKKEESLNIEIVDDDYLKNNLGGSLMNSLERLPGVTTIDIGSGQSKPVIRGLGFNRVVVVENNIKHEAQQWGADHGLEIDQYAVDHIEIIKGPASLMYGSDAIGGVIDLKKRKLPTENSFGGAIDLSGKTNNDFLGTSISLYGRKRWFFADARATILDYADYKVPTDNVDVVYNRVGDKIPLYKNHMRNTAGKEQNFHLTLGIVQSRWKSKIYISDINSKNGFFANAHGLEPRSVNFDLHDKSNRDINNPYQQVNHFKTLGMFQYNRDKMEFESNLGFQHNFRQEWSDYTSHYYMPAIFPDTLDFSEELERQFKKFIYSGNAVYTYFITNKMKLLTGINFEYQNNTIDGRGFIIPAFTKFTTGGYILSKYSVSQRTLFQLGVRYDYGLINTESYFDWFPSPLDETSTDTTWIYKQRAYDLNLAFKNVSWSIGVNYNAEKWLLKANVGKSFRMPTPQELAANGINYHFFRYEIGDSSLVPETSYQLDAGLEFNTNKLAIGLTPFMNYFSNYIYLNPTYKHKEGYQVFYYTQSEVFRYGTEIHAHYQIVKSLQVGVMGEYVYSVQLSGEKKGYTLPFSPPASAIINLKYQWKKIRFIKNAYFSVDYRITSAQDNIVPPEETTDGYQVINLGLGGDIKMKNQKVTISMQVQNLLNNKYFNHTSYYRLINVPESGRNFIVNISFPFSGKLKQEK